MNEPFLLAGVVAILAIAAYFTLRGHIGRRLRVASPILPAKELQRRYGLYAENRPVIRLDPEKVPAHLRDLIPLAETWGIGDDIIRLDFEQKASDAARQELLVRLDGRLEEVERWVHGHPSGIPLSDEAVAFMYLLSAWDEVRPIDRS